MAGVQVSAIEPLTAPTFTRTGITGLRQSISTIVTVNYEVSSAARTTSETLRGSIAKLFHDKGWLDGMPKGMSSATLTDNGVVRYPLAFHASSERFPNIAYMWIADDLSAIQCTYIIRKK